MRRTRFECRICGAEVDQMNSMIEKSASMKAACCSLPCFKKTPEYQEKRKLADQIRVKKIRDSGGFETNGLKSKITRAKRFLEYHAIPFSMLSDEDALKLWEQEFRARAEHSEKIKAGRIKKHGSFESLRRADQERTVKASCTILGLEYREDFSSEEKKTITCDAYKNFRVKDKLSWKLKHLLKQGIVDQTNDLTHDKIEKLYSGYVSDRFSRSSIETDKNGYTRSEKGWYLMTNQADGKFFYRSSWEKKVFEALDHLVGTGEIQSVFTPDRVQYELDGVKRHYYPDAAFVNRAGSKVVLEIKPARKVDDNCNAVKMAFARDKIGSNFHVLTEHEIFHSDLIKILGEM